MTTHIRKQLSSHESSVQALNYHISPSLKTGRSGLGGVALVKDISVPVVALAVIAPEEQDLPSAKSQV